MYPSYRPSKSAMTLRSAQMFHLYVSYFMYCSKCLMQLTLSLTLNACATGMDGKTFPLCRRPALRLTLEESKNRLLSSERWLIFNALNKPPTSLHTTRVPSMVKNSSRFFGDNDKDLFSRLHPDISIVSFWMPAFRPLPLAAPNRVLDHSVRFV